VIPHILEAAVLYNHGELIIIDGDIEELGNLTDLAWKVIFEIIVVDKLYIWQIACVPPGLDVFPKGPPGIAILV
jgi:hypothetical protein